MDAFETMVMGLETKTNDGYGGVVKSLEKSRSDVTTVLDQSKLDASAVQGCVEGVLRVQSREEKDEEEERERERYGRLMSSFTGYQNQQLVLLQTEMIWYPHFCVCLDWLPSNHSSFCLQSFYSQ